MTIDAGLKPEGAPVPSRITSAAGRLKTVPHCKL